MCVIYNSLFIITANRVESDHWQAVTVLQHSCLHISPFCLKFRAECSPHAGCCILRDHQDMFPLIDSLMRRSWFDGSRKQWQRTPTFTLLVGSSQLFRF